MKKQVLILFVLLTSISYTQYNYLKFYSLTGMDDSLGKTQLIYSIGSRGPMFSSDVIYLMDVNTLSEKPKFYNYSYGNGANYEGFSTQDYKFWNNDTAKYIFSVEEGEISNRHSYVERYDGIKTEGLGGRLIISEQNDNLVYCYPKKSTDAGISWTTIPFFVIAISPYNDNELFIGDTGGLYKSTNGGQTSYFADSGNSTLKMIFDPDSVHIYRFCFISPDLNIIRVSNNKGEPGSWTLLPYQSNNYKPIPFSQDNTGRIYLALDKKILFSDDHGTTFSTLFSFNREIVGIYKKPDSNLLYYANEDSIMVYNGSTVNTVKYLRTVGITDELNSPEEFILYNNYPNPFNSSTRIRFNLPNRETVQIKLYDILGKEIAILFNEERYQGVNDLFIDLGKYGLTSGTYFYRIKAGANTAAGKLIYLK